MRGYATAQEILYSPSPPSPPSTGVVFEYMIYAHHSAHHNIGGQVSGCLCCLDTSER